MLGQAARRGKPVDSCWLAARGPFQLHRPQSAQKQWLFPQAAAASGASVFGMLMAAKRELEESEGARFVSQRFSRRLPTTEPPILRRARDALP